MANRLAHEKSLYLRQHAENPVDWYPWCEEAFQRALQEDKPIFLSIGYSACHWCHVMERESFADPEVAQVLNEHFVCIKVDREERPDVDAFYMQACQAITGHGGWPLTIIMTPSKLPFFASTYFPKTDRYGRPGLLTLLRQIAELWRTRRQDLLSYAQRVVEFLRTHRQPLGSHPTSELLQRAYEQLERQYDPRYGGFGGAPKFPMVPQLLFLLRWWYRTGESKALQMVEHSLQQMRFGGLYDHVGFGFHRYATDERWRIPHFEKMLYDQALLLLAYAEAYQIRPSPLWAQTVREVIAYCERELLAPEGAFYTSEDADSAGEEGAFYLWSDAELRHLLSDQEYEFLRFAFGVEPYGNLPELGQNHLFQTAPWEALGEHFGLATEALQHLWETIRQKLFAYRRRRVPPQRDEKVLTDWNGLMLAALCTAARSLGDERYQAMASRTAGWFLRCWKEHGTLFHCYADGSWSVPGLLDDYAFLLWGLVELYGTQLDVAVLEAALQIGQQLRERFWDSAAGAFYLTSPSTNELPLRYREDADGATPSGAAVACWNFLRLAYITGDTQWQTWAEEALAAAPTTVQEVPMAFPGLLIALDMAHGPTSEICFLAETPSDGLSKLIQEAHRHFLPRSVFLGAVGKDVVESFRRLAPAYTQYPLLPEPAAYVCVDGACQRPVTTAESLRELLPIRQAE
ncbi:MAG: thioredoxin domain-containing protein [Chlorobiota bacterium]